MVDDNIDAYLAKAREFEERAEKADSEALRQVYQELARQYRALANHIRRGLH